MDFAIWWRLVIAMACKFMDCDLQLLDYDDSENSWMITNIFRNKQIVRDLNLGHNLESSLQFH